MIAAAPGLVPGPSPRRDPAPPVAIPAAPAARVACVPLRPGLGLDPGLGGPPAPLPAASGADVLAAAPGAHP